MMQAANRGNWLRKKLVCFTGVLYSGREVEILDTGTIFVRNYPHPMEATSPGQHAYSNTWKDPVQIFGMVNSDLT